MAKEVQKTVTGVESSLLAVATSAAQSGLPPVHLWNPPDCGKIDMRIARDGTWFYLGSPIGRKPLVKLFASILRRDESGYVLVTPVEKVSIEVDDAPFVAVDFEVENPGKSQVVTFVTNVDDRAIANLANPVRLETDPVSGEPSPYVHVRRGMEALIDRKSFYRLVDYCCHEAHQGENWFGIWSANTFFPLLRSRDMGE